MTATSDLLSQIALTVREHHLFNSADTLIVALSGGADSTALLDLLIRLPMYNLRLVAAHLNHCLRGVESDGDEDFCRKLTTSYGIPLEIRRIDVKTLAESERLNLEDAGRRARIAFLDQIREKYCAAAIVTAHHSDDQAETVLMRLLRGSGMTGLSGMQYRNQRGYVRPLLDASRTQIEQYLTESKMEWREDASNLDTKFLRNRIRHELMPLLEQYNPSIRRSLIATAAIMSDENEFLDTLSKQTFENSFRRDGSVIVCSVTGLKSQPLALQRRILRHACRQLAGNLDGFNLEHMEAIRQLLNSPRPNARVSLPQGISAVREYDLISLRLNPVPTPCDAADLILSATGLYPLPNGGSLEIETCQSPPDFNVLPAESACFDLNKTPFPWLVRTFRPGDRMMPLGMTGKKKVKDIFIDRKIPLSERKLMPLLFCGDDLIWIAGVCTSQTGRIDNMSGTIIRVTWHKQHKSFGPI